MEAGLDFDIQYFDMIIVSVYQGLDFRGRKQ